MENFIRKILSQMSAADKIRLSFGRDTLSIGKMEKFGIREVFMADGPQGIRREDGNTNTALPCGVALAAGFDTALAEEYGKVIGEEARACGIRASLGPGMNLTRTPLNGRTFEYYGEDPVLAGKIAAGYVRGCQSKGVAATPKHMALNNQEICRTTGDSICDKNTLRELYLEAFEIVCREAKPWMIMSSYNKINGEDASACSYTQKEFLRDECGFDGVVVSDWGGTHDAKNCILGGQDLEMGGGEETVMNMNLPQLVENGQIPMEVLDEMALHNLRLLYRMGAFEEKEDCSGFECNSKDSQNFARRAASECAVLLKNQNRFLPLKPGKYKKIAVIGPSANYPHLMAPMLWCGGSGAVHPPYEVTILDAVRKRFPDCEVSFAGGVRFDLDCMIDSKLAPAGFSAQYFKSQEEMEQNAAPFLSRTETLPLRFGILNAGGMTQDPAFTGTFAVRLKGTVIPQKDGKAAMQLGIARFFTRFFVNGTEVKEPGDESRRLFDSPRYEFEAKAGVPLEVEIEAWRYSTEDAELRLLYFEDEAAGVAEAEQLAREADLVIYAGGTHHGYDKEGIGWGNVTGADIPDLLLPSNQDELLSRITKANPNTAVVLINGSVVDTSRWIDTVPAVLEMFYPGMEGGNAVLDILTGDASPNGRLPFSWSDKLSDYPAHANGNYPGVVEGEKPWVRYDEGKFIGYRYMDLKEISPRFPFGFGLSYADFEHELLSVEKVDDAAFKLKFRVKNVSEFAGASVIQLYVASKKNLPERPEKVLRNFEKVHLDPGKETVVSIELTARDFSFCDAKSSKIRLFPGMYQLLAGTSSRSFFASAQVEVC